MGERSVVKWVQMLPAVVAGVMLVAAIARLPYWYYFYLRIVVCGASAYTAYIAYRRRTIWASCLLGLMAILFNPVKQINLDRQVWQVIDVVCVVFLLIVVVVLTRTRVSRGRGSREYE